jgi:uncharacterized protein (DUF58 family)
VGAVFLLLSAASATAGLLFKETALLVFGSLFLAILGYCLGACLIMAARYRKRASGMSVDFVPSAAAIGEPVTVLLGGGAKRFWMPPVILARYMVRLKTRDFRIAEKIFPGDFFTEKHAALTVEERGAYFGECDYLLICDILGFFQIRVKTAPRNGERLLVYPNIFRERNAAVKTAGGDKRTVKNASLPDDDLIEQRQYIPGDDPRRINWKLYGHSEELFVREGEKRGEPLSEVVIVVDTDTAKKDRRGTADILCGRALEIAATVAATSARTASSVVLHYRGGEESGRRWTQDMDIRGLYALFALPFAVSGGKPAESPESVEAAAGAAQKRKSGFPPVNGVKGTAIVVKDA